MKQSSYIERDDTLGQAMLILGTTIGQTRAQLATLRALGAIEDYAVLSTRPTPWCRIKRAFREEEAPLEHLPI